MNVLSGKLMILDLGTPNVKYFWYGEEIPNVVKVFVYKGTRLSMTVSNKEAVPYAEMKAYGINVKEQK